MNISIKDDTIVQIWIRTSVKRDQELSQMAAQSKGSISQETIVRNHPWVEDPEAEMAAIKKEEEEQNGEISDMFPKDDPDDDQGGDE